MNKQDILDNIQNVLEIKPSNERNSMGVSESYYNAYYLIGMCFTNGRDISLEKSKLPKMTERELNNLIKLADYASDAFY